MKLNLEMLAVDFQDMNAQASLHASAHPRRLRFGDIPHKGQPMQPDRLYIIEPEQVALDDIADLPFAPALIVSGRPSEELLTSKANLLWFEPAIEIVELITLVMERFEYYNSWERALLEKSNRGEPIAELGKVSEPIFNRPLFMWDALFQTIFAVWNEDHYKLPKGYIKHENETQWSTDEVNAVDSVFLDSRDLKGTYILPAVFGYRSMCRNIVLSGDYVATISVDEIGEEFNARDEALLEVLEEHLAGNLRFNPQLTMSTTYKMHRVLEQLLEKKKTDPSDIASELARMKWESDGTFCVVFAAPENPHYTDERLATAGDQVARRIGNTLFTVFERGIAFIINLSCMSAVITEETATRHAAAQAVFEEFERGQFAVALGVSHAFYAFGTLEAYYRQARWAIGLGNSRDPNGEIFFFDDYLIEHVRQRVLEDVPAEALCPNGLMRLRRYDAKNGTDLVETLEAYLNNNMSSTQTANALFMHRNTLINRLKLINSIGQMDLQNPETQLAVRLGLRLTKDWQRLDSVKRD